MAEYKVRYGLNDFDYEDVVVTDTDYSAYLKASKLVHLMIEQEERCDGVFMEVLKSGV